MVNHAGRRDPHDSPADGYSSDYIYCFNRSGKYPASFGGKPAPYSFDTLGKIAIDTRLESARIIACDREHNRAVQFSPTASGWASWPNACAGLRLSRSVETTPWWAS